MEALFSDLRRTVALEDGGEEDVDRVVQSVNARLIDSACWVDAVAGMASAVRLLLFFCGLLPSVLDQFGTICTNNPNNNNAKQHPDYAKDAAAGAEHKRLGDAAVQDGQFEDALDVYAGVLSLLLCVV